MDEDLKKEIRGFALQNSSAHGGSTDSKIIIGKILGTRPELRSMTGQIIPEIQSIVKEVNAMSAADQIAELKSEGIHRRMQQPTLCHAFDTRWYTAHNR